MNDDKIQVLNKILQGEHMAIDAYDVFIDCVSDDRIKSEFEEIQSEHRQHAQEILTRIHELGGEPNNDTGLKGIIANGMLKFKSRNMSSRDIVKKAYEGENRGISTTEKFLKVDFDDESFNIVENALIDDQEHLKKLKNLMKYN